MKAFLDAISAVTGPLTLVAFLAVIVLGIIRWIAREGQGLEIIYKLVKERLTRDQFYDIAKDIINKMFWLIIIIFIVAMLAYVISLIIPAIFPQPVSVLPPTTQ